MARTMARIQKMGAIAGVANLAPNSLSAFNPVGRISQLFSQHDAVASAQTTRIRHGDQQWGRAASIISTSLLALPLAYGPTKMAQALTRGQLGIGLLSPVRSPSQESMHEGEMSRLGKWGLIVPAKTAEPSSSINRVNALASASVANIFVSRGLRCLGGTPRLRSNVTYQVGVIAPS